MKNLFEAAKVEEVKERIARLRPDSQRQWGKMNAAQAVAHCSAGLEGAVGDRIPSRLLLGRILGRIVKPMALGNDAPMRRNSPTVKDLVVQDERDLGTERERLCGLIDRFAATGPKGCTTHPHSFFGRLTPEEGATSMYKHLDHHLRQLGAWVAPSPPRRYSGSSYWCPLPSMSFRILPDLARSCRLVILVAPLPRTFASAIHYSAIFCSRRIWACCSGVVSTCANPASARSSRCAVRKRPRKRDEPR